MALETGGESAELIYGLVIGVFFMVILLLFLFALYVEPYKMMAKQILFKEMMKHEEGTELDDYEKTLLKRQGLDTKRNTRRNSR
ncbi:MAG: hypothetical protein U5K84_10415 [Alkalibacterium sp.]|nr:hypothetical protein [Alkalibacterium sp.]